MFTLVAAAVVNVIPKPVPLEALTLTQARRLDGGYVVVSLTAGTVPVTVFGGDTSVGVGETDDGTERGVILKGDRLDVEPGDRLVVGGILRVIDHPPACVGGEQIPAWVEVRVEQE